MELPREIHESSIPFLIHCGQLPLNVIENLRNKYDPHRSVRISYSGALQSTMIDYIPILSQIKSAILEQVGDVEGAQRTDENYLRDVGALKRIQSVLQAVHGEDEARLVDWIPGLSQIKSTIQTMEGDLEGAQRTQANFARYSPTVTQIADLLTNVTIQDADQPQQPVTEVEAEYPDEQAGGAIPEEELEDENVVAVNA